MRRAPPQVQLVPQVPVPASGVLAACGLGALVLVFRRPGKSALPAAAAA